MYANTLVEPLDPFFDDPQWAGLADWRAELAPHYRTARRMLGAATVPAETPADLVVREVAGRMGVEDTVRPTDVAVFFGEPGVAVADPYFGGEGPGRVGCTHCGGCMTGCRVGAKNSLDRNYLWLAERLGVEIRAEREVRRLRRRDDGWELECERPGAWTRRRARSCGPTRSSWPPACSARCGSCSARACRGSPPRLGDVVRTNSEAIVGAAAPKPAGLSQGVAITSSFRPDDETVIEPVRYGAGSNAMGLLGTILVDGGGRVPRPLRFAAEAVRHPVVFARSLSVRRWSERTLILLVMQARDNRLRLTLRRGRLRSSGADIPTYLPHANAAARHAAAVLGGQPGSSLNEVLLGGRRRRTSSAAASSAPRPTSASSIGTTASSDSRASTSSTARPSRRTSGRTRR